MSAIQPSPNVAEVLCQSQYNFRSYSILGDDRFCIKINTLKSQIKSILSASFLDVPKPVSCQ